MRILHISDTHGLMPSLPSEDLYDVIVHSGDFLPNRTRGLAAIEIPFQQEWMERHSLDLLKWLRKGKPILTIGGNHDYIDVSVHLRRMSLDAQSIANRQVEVLGRTFQGFEMVPRFGGEWNNERSENEIDQWFAEFEKTREFIPDVFVSHAPIYGVLDRSGNNRCGSKAMREFFLTAPRPKAFLHGHIHEAGGRTEWPNRGDMIISNAGDTPNIIEI